MAKSRDNVVMQGASGRIGKTLVFRQKGDQTIIARTGKKRADGKPYTEKQLKVQNRFIDASLYAKKAIQEIPLKALYEARANINQTAYNVAFKDYFTAPMVRRLDDRNYFGQIGDAIKLMIKDVLKVTQVKIEILDSSETLIESGSATALDNEGIEWEYIAKVDNFDYESTLYRISMVDTPENTTVVLVEYGQGMI